MTEKEFDDVFSENVRNARSVIHPDEQDWQNLSSKIDRFHSKSRYWLRVLPWLLLLLVSSYNLWLHKSVDKITQNLAENSKGKGITSITRDTLFLEKKIYLKDTIYKFLPVYKRIKKIESGENVQNNSLAEINNPVDNLIEKDSLVKKNLSVPFDQINAGNNLSFLFKQQGEEKPENKYFEEKIGSKLNIKSSVGFSVGSFLPINSNEIKNPLAIALQAEFEMLPRFSIRPSLLYTQHFFELEDLNSAKMVFSSTNNLQGTYTLHEIKCIKKTVIPAIAFNYYFYETEKVEGYLGAGVAADFSFPTQLDYEFKDLINNNSYKYSLKDKLGASNPSFFSNLGGKINTKSAISFSGEIRAGISKNQTSVYTPFIAVLTGISFEF